jgi:TrmH family RNA methyltransferase
MSLSAFEIILVEPIYPGNVGALARSASNYGIETIKIIGDLDVLCHDAKKMSLYGYPLLQNAARFETLAEAVESCNLVIGTVQQERYNRTPPLPSWTITEQYRDQMLSGKTALVFGREDNGLTRDEIDQCHVLSTIATPEGLSFNLAHSVSLYLYEIYRAVHNENHVNSQRHPCHSELEELIELIQVTLLSVGFFRTEHHASSMTRIRDIVFRMNLSASDVPILKALFYKIHHFAGRAVPLLPEEMVRDCIISDH